MANQVETTLCCVTIGIPTVSCDEDEAPAVCCDGDEAPRQATQGKEDKEDEHGNEDLSIPRLAGAVASILASSYFFLVGLALMGDAVKCLGGQRAGRMFASVDNPIAGLMVGILATTLVQSSSTSTSIVVGLVNADQLTVTKGIPIIMGANIGTSVTNIIVAMGQSGERCELERAFAGASLHNLFNVLMVCILLPLELITEALAMAGKGVEGGFFFWIAKGLTSWFAGKDQGGKLFASPVKAITKPLAKTIISNDMDVIEALALHAPAAVPLRSEDINATHCARGRRLDDEVEDASRALLARRLEADCSQYYCINSDLDKNFKSIDEKAYKKLTKCAGYVTLELPCASKEECYLDAGAYYVKYVTNRRIIKGGLVEDIGDFTGGIIAGIVGLLLSLISLCAGILALRRFFRLLMKTRAKAIVIRANRMISYDGILIGGLITVLLQSSSLTTSALTPLCGIGVLRLEMMLPLTLGANIGTTVTALIAAFSTMKFSGLQVAFCHLLFNVIGVLLWYPIPRLRSALLASARLLGLYAYFYRLLPACYVLCTFVLLPTVILGISEAYKASVAAGVAVTAVLAANAVQFAVWWIHFGGCYRVLSREAREKHLRELEEGSDLKAHSDVDAADVYPWRPGGTRRGDGP